MDYTGEHELLEAIRGSDYAAFEELHRRYYQQLYTLAVKKIGDKDETYDLLQDMFIELWNRRETFFISNPLQNYLQNRLWFKIAGYFRTKGFREKHFKNFKTFIQTQHSIIDQPDAIESRESDLQYETILAIINKTIDEMPEKMREVFLLSRSNEYTIKEIAEQLDISPKTVKNQINIAFNRIRQATAGNSITTLELLFFIWLSNR